MEQQFPYQVIGSKWLAQKQWALLADEMGLGKSCQVVTASDIVGAVSILIVCPASARHNWLREFNMWSIFSRDFKLCFSSEDYPGERTICSFNYLTDHADRFKGKVWDLGVIDESHFAKSSEAQRTRAIFGKNGIVRWVKRLWCISGTPAPNNNSELWVILYTFGLTPLKYDDFIQRYCVTYTKDGRRFVKGNKTEHDQEIREMLSKIMLRRLKEDVMKELPPIHYSDYTVEAGEVDFGAQTCFFEYTFPEDRRQELLDKIESDRKLVEMTYERVTFTKNGMKALEGIAQSVSTLRRYVGLQKVKPVAELVIKELEAKKYDKIVIFAVHRDVIETLRQLLSKYGAVTIYGGTDPETRQRNIDRFQNSPKFKVFIGNIQAAGTAITLTSAHQVLFVEQSWTPGDNAQAAMRCHRIGQHRPVFVRFVGLAGSIDQAIAQTLKRKTRELTSIFDKKED